MVNQHVPAHPAFGVADESTSGGSASDSSYRCQKVAKIAKVTKTASPQRAEAAQSATDQALRFGGYRIAPSQIIFQVAA